MILTVFFLFTGSYGIKFFSFLELSYVLRVSHSAISAQSFLIDFISLLQVRTGKSGWEATKNNSRKSPTLVMFNVIFKVPSKSPQWRFRGYCRSHLRISD